MKKKKLKGGKIRMKNVIAILAVSLALLLSLGTFASLADAAIYQNVNRNVVSYTDRITTTYAKNTDDAVTTYAAPTAVVAENGDYVTKTNAPEPGYNTYNSNIAEAAPQESSVRETDMTQAQYTTALSVNDIDEKNNVAKPSVAENKRAKVERSTKNTVISRNTDDAVKENKMDTASPYGKKGDVNNDGQINFGDINWFTMVYYNQWFFKEYHPDLFWRTDIDDSGTIDGTDVNMFVALLSH